MATDACDALMSAIKTSQLDFLIQETPYSCFVTIRKKFSKGYNSKVEVTEHKKDKNQSLCDELKCENQSLKEYIDEKERQLKVAKEESNTLYKKLEKAEQKMIIHCEENAKQETKTDSEISVLKAQVKDKNKAIVEYKAEEVKANKTIKTLEKKVHDLENKIQNMNDKIESINTSRSSLKNERDKLFNEVKNRRENLKMSLSMKTRATQTQTELLEIPTTNNNPNPELVNTNSKSNRSLSTVSSASQTYSSTVSSASQTSSDMSKLEIAAETIDCVVCNKIFLSASSLRIHTENEHDLILCPLKLIDNDEENHFVRFIKSIQIDEEYIEERKQFYPAHWDSLGERIKIRKLAQMKLTIVSEKIEENMRRNPFKNYGWRGGSIDI